MEYFHGLKISFFAGKAPSFLGARKGAKAQRHEVFGGLATKPGRPKGIFNLNAFFFKE
jgi:hypothetical protein